jgi:hypothetical protein
LAITGREEPLPVTEWLTRKTVWANLLSILPTLELHHGEVGDDHFSFPDGFVLGALGIAPADAVTSALKEFGFSTFTETAEGFEARK